MTARHDKGARPGEVFVQLSAIQRTQSFTSSCLPMPFDSETFELTKKEIGIHRLRHSAGQAPLPVACRDDAESVRLLNCNEQLLAQNKANKEGD